MARFTQDFRVDCILLHAQKEDNLAYASRYLKIPAQDIGARLMWLRRQPDSYKRRIEAQVKILQIRAKAYA